MGYKDHGKSYDAVYNRKHPAGFRWLHESFGTNWRITEMQSAMGECCYGACRYGETAPASCGNPEPSASRRFLPFASPCHPAESSFLLQVLRVSASGEAACRLDQ